MSAKQRKTNFPGQLRHALRGLADVFARQDVAIKHIYLLARHLQMRRIDGARIADHDDAKRAIVLVTSAHTVIARRSI
ncbi:MAG: hypothetical protein ABIQ70_11990 [Dokdonella sp.]